MSGLQKGDKIVSVDGVEAEVSTVRYSIETELVHCLPSFVHACNNESYPIDSKGCSAVTLKNHVVNVACADILTSFSER